MVQTLMMISNTLFVLSAVSLVTAGVLFVRLDIRGVIEELTGKSARKSIEQLREDNKKSGVRRFHVLDRSVTDQVSVLNVGKADGNTKATEPLPSETVQEGVSRRKKTEPLASEQKVTYQETTGLEDGKNEYLETSYMNDGIYSQEDFLKSDAESLYASTTVLEESNAYTETSTMEETMQDAASIESNRNGETVPLGNRTLQILQDIVLIHTDEIIPL